MEEKQTVRLQVTAGKDLSWARGILAGRGEWEKIKKKERSKRRSVFPAPPPSRPAASCSRGGADQETPTGYQLSIPLATVSCRTNSRVRPLAATTSPCDAAG